MAFLKHALPWNPHLRLHQLTMMERHWISHRGPIPCRGKPPGRQKSQVYTWQYPKPRGWHEGELATLIVHQLKHTSLSSLCTLRCCTSLRLLCTLCRWSTSLCTQHSPSTCLSSFHRSHRHICLSSLSKKVRNKVSPCHLLKLCFWDLCATLSTTNPSDGGHGVEAAKQNTHCRQTAYHRLPC